MSPDIAKCVLEGKITPTWEPTVFGLNGNITDCYGRNIRQGRFRSGCLRKPLCGGDLQADTWRMRRSQSPNTGGEELSRLQERQVQRPWVLTLLDPRNWNKTGGAEFLAKSKVGDAGKDKITQDLADHWEDQFWKNPKQQPLRAHSVGLGEHGHA